MNNKIIDNKIQGTLDKLESIPNYSVDMSMVRNICILKKRLCFFLIKIELIKLDQFDMLFISNG